MGFASTLAHDESLMTISLNIHFFRPVWQARLKAEARVIKGGKNVGYIECDVTDEHGKQICESEFNLLRFARPASQSEMNSCGPTCGDAIQARALSIIISQMPLDLRMSSIVSRIAPWPASAFVV